MNRESLPYLKRLLAICEDQILLLEYGADRIGERGILELREWRAKRESLIAKIQALSVKQYRKSVRTLKGESQ